MLSERSWKCKSKKLSWSSYIFWKFSAFGLFMLFTLVLKAHFFRLLTSFSSANILIKWGLSYNKSRTFWKTEINIQMIYLQALFDPVKHIKMKTDHSIFICHTLQFINLPILLLKIPQKLRNGSQVLISHSLSKIHKAKSSWK